MIEQALAKLSAATRALDEARTVDEIKQIMDLAEAARLYAKKAHLGLEAQNYAAEIHLDGARKAGELLKQLERNHHDTTGDDGKYRGSNVGHSVSEYRAVLEETGTTRQDAARWQQMATVPAPIYAEYKKQIKDSGQELTTSGVLKIFQALERQEVTVEKPSHPLSSGHDQILGAQMLPKLVERFNTEYGANQFSFKRFARFVVDKEPDFTASIVEDFVKAHLASVKG